MNWINRSHHFNAYSHVIIESDVQLSTPLDILLLLHPAFDLLGENRELEMSKREHGKMNGSGENNETRHKRRRDAGGSSSDVDIGMSDPIVEESKAGEPVDVKEDGLRLWQTVKDAVNKE